MMAAYNESSTPDLTLFAGRRWSEWQTAIKLQGVSDNNLENSYHQKKEVARLKKNDFSLFGLCPAKDKFYVVICEHCGLPFKPQGFRYHIEKYHKMKTPNKIEKDNNIAKPSRMKVADDAIHKHSGLCFKPVSNSPREDREQRSVRTNNLHPSFDSINSDRSKHATPHVPAAARSRLENHRNVPPKVHAQHAFLEARLDKKTKTLNSFEGEHSKNRCGPATTPKSSNAIANTALRKLSSSTLSPSAPNDNEKRDIFDKPHKISRNTNSSIPAKRDRTPSSVPLNASTPAPTLPSHRPYKHHHNPQLDIVKSGDRGNSNRSPASADPSSQQAVAPSNAKLQKFVAFKAHNPDKQCGVWVEKDNAPCTRSLACNAHSINAKRRVSGRSKPFDELLLEQVDAKRRLKDAERLSAPTNHIAKETIKTDLKVHNSEKRTNKSEPATPLRKKVTASNPTKSSSTQSKKINLFPRTNPPVIVDLWKPVSNPVKKDESDPRLSCKPAHPTPITNCHFGRRSLSRNFIACNRNMDRQWSALQALTASPAPTSSNRSRYSLAPVPSISESVLATLKEGKAEGGKPSYFNLTKRESSLFNFRSSDFRSALFNQARLLKRPFACQRRQVVRAKSSHVATSSVNHKTRPQCGESRRIESAPEPPPAKSSRRSLSLDNILFESAETSRDHLAAPNNVAALNRNILGLSKAQMVAKLAKQCNFKSKLQTPHKANAVNGRRGGNARKVVLHQQASVKHSPSPRNGLTTNAITSHDYPQSLTLSGGIGALRSNFIAANNPTHKVQQQSTNCSGDPSSLHLNSDSFHLDVGGLLSSSFDLSNPVSTSMSLHPVLEQHPSIHLPSYSYAGEKASKPPNEQPPAATPHLSSSSFPDHCDIMSLLEPES